MALIQAWMATPSAKLIDMCHYDQGFLVCQHTTATINWWSINNFLISPSMSLGYW